MIGGILNCRHTMNPHTAIRANLKNALYCRRSFRGSNCHKGRGKRIAHKADRRLGKALTSEVS